MDATVIAPARTFVAASEIWVPQGQILVHAGGNYGSLSAFEKISGQERFSIGEGLPGRAWSEARPVILRSFDESNFRRTEAAKAAGLTSAVAIPVFKENELKAVLVALCSDDEERVGAIEIWSEIDGLLMLQDGYYGAAKEFEFVSQHTHFPRGQGLPGGVWAARTPILMRDLGSGYRFIRADSAGKAGLTTGLGIPVPAPGGKTYVLTLLSARGTPIARRFEIWDARAVKSGQGNAVLVDGLCEREGPLWSDTEPRHAIAWQGPLGRALGSGIPVVEPEGPGTAGYASFVALPVYRDSELAHIVAWYC